MKVLHFSVEICRCLAPTEESGLGVLVSEANTSVAACSVARVKKSIKYIRTPRCC